MKNYIIVAPFSNDFLKDWPSYHYAELIELCYKEFNLDVKIIGTLNQRAHANELVRCLPGDRVANLCGAIKWQDVERLILEAALVIGNNSGIPHYSSKLGIPTICIFGGMHSEAEWMPIGKKVYLIAKHVVCSPCSSFDCPYAKRCLTEISPKVVFEIVCKALEMPLENLNE